MTSHEGKSMARTRARQRRYPRDKSAGRLSRMAKEKPEQGKPPGRSRGSMVRKAIYVYEDEAAALEAEAEAKKCSEAEVVRRALRKYLEI